MAPKGRNTGFMSFVHEWRRNNPESKGMSLAESVDHCGYIWKDMNKLDRSPYKAEAKKLNLLKRNNPYHPLKKAELALLKASELQKAMKRRTEAIVMEAMKNIDLKMANFTLISVNDFSASAPGEMSGLAFSCQQGIKSGFTTLINPGSLDLGLASEAQHHSSTTHCLPLPPNALGESDMGKLYGQIQSYLRSTHGCKPITLFTKSDSVAMVKACFQYLAKDTAQTDSPPEILSLEYLLFLLKKQTLQIAGLPLGEFTQISSDSFLEADPFEFSSGISCEFHEDIDRTNYCSLSKVHRWAYSFCQYLCGDLNIALKPGKHIPLAANVESGIIPWDQGSPEKDEEPGCSRTLVAPSVEVTKYPLAGFGRGRVRGVKH